MDVSTIDYQLLTIGTLVKEELRTSPYRTRTYIYINNCASIFTIEGPRKRTKKKLVGDFKIKGSKYKCPFMGQSDE